MPASVETLSFFACHLADTHAYATVRTYLAAVRAMHVQLGLAVSVFESEHLALVLRGIRKSLWSGGRAARLPITPTILSSMQVAMPKVWVDGYTQSLYWAMFSLAFFGFFRVSELTKSQAGPAPMLSCLSLAQDKLIVQLKRSKADPFHQGCEVVIGKSTSPVCAHRAVVKYLKARMRLGQALNPQAPLFAFANGKAITPASFAQALQKVLAQAEVPCAEQYSSHSFRIGAATCAGKAGVPEWLIQAAGRWNSDCYKVYMRTDKCQIRDLAAAIVKV